MIPQPMERIDNLRGAIREDKIKLSKIRAVLHLNQRGKITYGGALLQIKNIVNDGDEKR